MNFFKIRKPLYFIRKCKIIEREGLLEQLIKIYLTMPEMATGLVR